MVLFWLYFHFICYFELESGNKSIYHDIYHERKIHYEFLKLYLVRENSVETKAPDEPMPRTAIRIKNMLEQLPLLK